MKNEDRIKVLLLIDKQPGIIRPEILRKSGLSDRVVKDILSSARKNGTHRPVWNDKSSCGWYHASVADEVEREIREAAEKRRKVRNKVNGARAWKRRMAASIEAFEGAPIQRKANASDPLPFVCRAVPSVFHLGAA